MISCPKCEAFEIAMESMGGGSNAVSAWSWSIWKCTACGRRWKITREHGSETLAEVA